ncbi:MAG: hypothetical protein CMC73_06065 [Flavobacteriaceae bacterium]|jgi:predicted transcriptional regulator|nr:hypothetical protein [Flavobacteriaceae bacterium]
MSGIIIPSNPQDQKKIRECMEEISNSYTRTEGERSFVKEAIENLAEEVDIPKKILRKMSRIYHKQNMSEVAGEIEDIEALMETFTPKFDNNEDG